MLERFFMMIKPKNRIKALSIKEPWISQILAGKKTVEFRSWRTSYTGEILLCGSKWPQGPCSGKAVAFCQFGEPSWDCVEGCWAWPILRVRPLEKPFAVQGQPGLFDVLLPS